MLDPIIVRRIQTALVDRGYAIKVDGDFGPNTLNAVAANLRVLSPDAPELPIPPTYTGLPLAWGVKVSADFRDEVRAIANRFQWSTPDMLMAIMAFESGETFSPSVKNMAGSGATGLIQFMPSTARGLGVTTDILSRMTALEQLTYVEKYFKQFGSKVIGSAVSLADLYMAVLMPKYITSPDNAVLFSGGGIAYRQNSGLDANLDGKITKGEAAAKVYGKLTKGKLAINAAA